MLSFKTLTRLLTFSQRQPKHPEKARLISQDLHRSPSHDLSSMTRKGLTAPDHQGEAHRKAILLLNVYKNTLFTLLVLHF